MGRSYVIDMSTKSHCHISGHSMKTKREIECIHLKKLLWQGIGLYFADHAAPMTQFHAQQPAGRLWLRRRRYWTATQSCPATSAIEWCLCHPIYCRGTLFDKCRPEGFDRLCHQVHSVLSTLYTNNFVRNVMHVFVLTFGVRRSSCCGS